MGGALIGGGGIAGIPGLPVDLALDQQRHAPGQQRNVPLLPGHDIGQILDHAGQVGDAFFECCLVGHGVQEARSGGFCKGFLAPVPRAG